MPILALSQNYHTRRNIPYLDNTTQLGMMRSVNWLLKAALTGEISTGTVGTNARPSNTLWAHVASCDSTAVSTGADLWGATYTPAALVWADSGSAHSWIHLRNALLGMDLVLELTAGTNTSLLVAMVPTVYGFTGGTTTTRPINSTYEVNGGYTTSSTSNWLTWQNDVTTGNNNFAHFTVGDDGSFYFTSTRQTTGGASSFFAIQKPQNSSSWPAAVGDTNNVQLMLASGVAPGNPGVFAYGSLCANAGGCIALLPNSTRATLGGMLSAFNFGGANFANAAMQVDGNTTEFPVHALPIQQWNNTSAQSATRGILRDWWVHPNRSLIPGGQTNDPAGVINHIVLGDFFLPWNGSAGPTI